ncbi:MAG: hypothetical protein M3066_01780 [Actinomycetota bacterium]|nr:hypothetical protein [Actinomycetota bacterium]
MTTYGPNAGTSVTTIRHHLQQGGFVKQEHVKDRLHQAMRRSAKVSEEELAEVTAVVIAIVGEVTAELALVIAELAARVEALEARGG